MRPRLRNAGTSSCVPCPAQRRRRHPWHAAAVSSALRVLVRSGNEQRLRTGTTDGQASQRSRNGRRSDGKAWKNLFVAVSGLLATLVEREERTTLPCTFWESAPVPGRGNEQTSVAKIAQRPPERRQSPKNPFWAGLEQFAILVESEKSRLAQSG